MAQRKVPQRRRLVADEPDEAINDLAFIVRVGAMSFEPGNGGYTVRSTCERCGQNLQSFQATLDGLGVPSATDRFAFLLPLIEHRLRCLGIAVQDSRPVQWFCSRCGAFSETNVIGTAHSCERCGSTVFCNSNTRPRIIPPEGYGTTAYCRRCGESPESGSHVFDHQYEPPVIDIATAQATDGTHCGPFRTAEDYRDHLPCDRCEPPCWRCGSRRHHARECPDDPGPAHP